MPRFTFCSTTSYFVLAEPDFKNWPNFSHSNKRVKVYCPFRSGPLHQGASPPFEFAGSKAYSESRIAPPKDRSALGMVYPTLRFERNGTTSATPVTELDSKPPILSAYPLNSFQIDIYAEDEASAQQLFRFYFPELVRRIRRQTLQYWIGRDINYFDEHLKAFFEVDESFSPKDGIWMGAQGTAPESRTVPLNLLTWQYCAETASKPLAIDWLDAILDAEHFSASDDYLNSIINSAVALEMLKYLLWDTLLDRGKCSKPQHKSATNDTSKPIQYFTGKLDEVAGTKNALGLSSEVADSLQLNWAARGIVAHGKSLELEKALKIKVDRKVTNKFVSSVHILASKIETYLKTNLAEGPS